MTNARIAALCYRSKCSVLSRKCSVLRTLAVPPTSSEDKLQTVNATGTGKPATCKHASASTGPLATAGSLKLSAKNLSFMSRRRHESKCQCDQAAHVMAVV